MRGGVHHDGRDGMRHRLGIPTHMAGKVGEAARPGPIDAETADDLADLLEMHDEQIPVTWPAGMSAGKARTLLAEHRASLTSVPARTGSATLLVGAGTAPTHDSIDVGPARPGSATLPVLAGATSNNVLGTPLNVYRM